MLYLPRHRRRTARKAGRDVAKVGPKFRIPCGGIDLIHLAGPPQGRELACLESSQKLVSALVQIDVKEPDSLPDAVEEWRARSKTQLHLK